MVKYPSAAHARLMTARDVIDLPDDEQSFVTVRHMDSDLLYECVYPHGWPIPPGADAEREPCEERRFSFFELGVRWGWWAEWDEHGPIPNPRVFKASDYAGKTMAHIMADAEVFSSVGDARRNGWNKPVECGEFKVGKRRPMIQVV